MLNSSQVPLLSRRRFLGWSQAALALLARPALATTDNTTPTDDYYQKLGVEKIINAAGTYTYLTASVMPPQVQRAVVQAALHPVVLDDLQKASGEYIARRLRCHRIRQVAGRRTRHRIEPEIAGLGQSHRDHAILETQGGQADGIIFQIEVLRSPLFGQAGRREQRREPRRNARLVVLGQR